MNCHHSKFTTSSHLWMSWFWSNINKPYLYLIPRQAFIFMCGKKRQESSRLKMASNGLPFTYELYKKYVVMLHGYLCYLTPYGLNVTSSSVYLEGTKQYPIMFFQAMYCIKFQSPTGFNLHGSMIDSTSQCSLDYLWRKQSYHTHGWCVCGQRYVPPWRHIRSDTCSYPQGLCTVTPIWHTWHDVGP